MTVLKSLFGGLFGRQTETKGLYGTSTLQLPEQELLVSGQQYGTKDDPETFVKPKEKLMGYEVQVTFKITKDGQGFHETTLKYENMAYEDVVQMEKFGAAAIGQLTAFGEERAKQKAGKK
jgi:hypothetical protein